MNVLCLGLHPAGNRPVAAFAGDIPEEKAVVRRSPEHTLTLHDHAAFAVGRAIFVTVFREEGLDAFDHRLVEASQLRNFHHPASLQRHEGVLVLELVEAVVEPALLRTEQADKARFADPLRTAENEDRVVFNARLHHTRHRSDQMLDRDSDSSKIESLTRRELEVLKMLSYGTYNKEIAEQLNISERTVKNHVSNIFKKIGVTDRTQAAVFAIRNNLITI